MGVVSYFEHFILIYIDDIAAIRKEMTEESNAHNLWGLLMSKL